MLCYSYNDKIRVVKASTDLNAAGVAEHNVMPFIGSDGVACDRKGWMRRLGGMDEETVVTARMIGPVLLLENAEETQYCLNNIS